ncbi:putative ferric-chelate reductase 1 isoform X2 [Myxocyprinus asiaticus]|uniref:putative ferric-chelate reductase 1 isoform X2 n=1 Tax=Myxocyprinus asiaticus TaxID=70543 RepID=UPI0022214AA9|nr:putative ferric-chelate reductase 1 isoform X2 [Myxocyprinus asiaticus]
MNTTSCLLYLLWGVSMFQFITCYSDGSLLDDQCQGMNINHVDESDVEIPAQNTEAPFNVIPEVQTFNYSQIGSTITVSLTAISSVSFNGFMLEARKCDSCPPAGTFSLVDSSSTLLICDSRAVSHTNNLDKRSITVQWVVPENGTFYFRAAFTKDYFTFWRRKPIILPTTAPTTVTTTVKPTTSQTVPSTLPPTSNTNSAPVPSTLPPQCVDYVRCVLALSLVSRLCFLDSSLLIIIRPVLKMVTMIGSVFELAFKIIAVIFVLIRAIQYVCVCDCAGLEVALPTLTVIAMVTSLLHTITVFLHCGPSHELKSDSGNEDIPMDHFVYHLLHA